MKKQYERICPECNKVITYKSQTGFCMGRKAKSRCKSCASKERLRTYSKNKRKHQGENFWETKEKAIKYLKEIAVNGHVSGPTQMHKQFGKLFYHAMKNMGGYKQLVKEAGLNITKAWRASDGHILSSYYEFLFDEFLNLNNVPHETEGRILPELKYRYDFKIKDVYVEIWGVSANRWNYDNKRAKKEKIYKDNNLKLLSIEQKDFAKSSLELQDFFKLQLAKFNILTTTSLSSYPVFNRIKIGYWCDKTISEELKPLIVNDRLPTSLELLKAGRTDLSWAIVKNGGYRKYAKLLGLEPQTKEFSEKYVINEINAIRKKIGHFPTDRELQTMKRSDLAGMIKNHGGYGYFQNIIEGKSNKKPYGYWLDEKNIIIEVEKIADKLGRFPKYKELGLITRGINASRKGMNYFRKIVEGNKHGTKHGLGGN